MKRTIDGTARLLPSLGALAAIGWCGLAPAQFEPQTLPSDVAARPINDVEPESSNVLRWKSKPRATAGDYVATELAPHPINSSTPPSPLRAGWNITRIDPSVRPAQHAAGDPFSDPFGDRRASNGTRNVPTTEGPSLILQPTQAETSVEELPPPRTLSPTRSPALPSPMQNVAQQLPSPQSAAPPDLPLPTDPPCDKMYQDRNCCKLIGDCIAFRNRLLSDSIRNISLDITPPFKHDPNVTEDEARADKLRRQGVRSWRNRRGAIVATGQMIDIENAAVVLADENGREVARVAIDDLAEDELCYLSAMWDLPSECPLGGIRTARRDWLCSTLQYQASALCHKPLYFEEVQIERYGHTAGPFRQPLISGAHFILNLAMLPYHMGYNPPTECQYSLGYYRAGNCAPWMIPPFPLSLEGAKMEVLAALGMAYLIP